MLNIDSRSYRRMQILRINKKQTINWLLHHTNHKNQNNNQQTGTSINNLNYYIYLLMSRYKQQKSDLLSKCQLPFVQYKLKDIKYARRNRTSPTKNPQKYLINNNQYYFNKFRSDRIKGQFINICQKIKQQHSDARNFSHANNRKLIIQDNNQLCPIIFGKMLKTQKNVTQPTNQVEPNPLSIALQTQNNQDYIPLMNYPIQKNYQTKKYIKKLMPNNYPNLRRLQTDYLSIQSLKLGFKGIYSKCTTPQKLYLKGSGAITNYDQESGQKIVSLRSPRNAEQIKQVKKLESRKQICSASTSVCSTKARLMNAHKQKASMSQSPKKSPTIKRAFKIPYETYYYRDLLWKMIIQTPLEYQHRLRVYIGKGNNSGLIRGLIKRRIWFAITDRIEQANFVWTQLKYLPYFQLQKQWKQEIQTLQNSSKNCKILDTGLLMSNQVEQWEMYFANYQKIQQRQDEKLLNRSKYFAHKKNPQQIVLGEENNSQQLLKIRNIIKNVEQIRSIKMHNHFKNNYMIGNKKTLFKTMSLFYKNRNDYVFNYLPHTFHITDGIEDESYYRFLRFYYQRAKQNRNKFKDASNKNNSNQEEQCNAWIVKPGENSNRGYGIRLCKTLEQIKAIIKQRQKLADGSQRTYIVQAYLQKPLLYQKRKFDLRHYMMMTCVNGVLKGYWYREGYVRTSSIQYSLSTKQSKVHLTNDAVQQKMPQYGKYQKGNKLSYQQLHIYLDRLYGYKNYNFKDIIIPKMKKITTDVIRACSGSIDNNFHGNNFQIFGLDFMIDSDFNVWLIEVNTNPCLDISCPLLGSIIPKMIENALQLTLDSMFPPPVRYNPKGIHYTKNLSEENKFDLVYDSRIDGINRESINAIDEKLLQEEDDQFEDDGQQWDQDD